MTKEKENFLKVQKKLQKIASKKVSEKYIKILRNTIIIMIIPLAFVVPINVKIIGHRLRWFDIYISKKENSKLIFYESLFIEINYYFCDFTLN